MQTVFIRSVLSTRYYQVNEKTRKIVRILLIDRVKINLSFFTEFIVFSTCYCHA